MQQIFLSLDWILTIHKETETNSGDEEKKHKMNMRTPNLE